mmetsp:Transcript_10283/g.34937  ORF Transcript_10283/g.34937 Transcript_10283/m.34937 type:complete len:222 (+) Transcript_10283:21-686(+)
MDGAFVADAYLALASALRGLSAARERGDILMATLVDFSARAHLFREAQGSGIGASDQRRARGLVGILADDPAVVDALVAKHERGLHNLLVALRAYLDDHAALCREVGDLYTAAWLRYQSAGPGTDPCEQLRASAPGTLGADAREQVCVPSIAACLLDHEHVYGGCRREARRRKALVAGACAGLGPERMHAAAEEWRRTPDGWREVAGFVLSVAESLGGGAP